MGTMPILDPDGGYQLNLTDLLDSRLGGDNQRPCFQDLSRSPPVERVRNISIVTGTTMVEDCTYQAELVE